MSHLTQSAHSPKGLQAFFTCRGSPGLNKMAVVCLAVLSLLLSCVVLTPCRAGELSDYFVSEHHVIKISPVRNVSLSQCVQSWEKGAELEKGNQHRKRKSSVSRRDSEP